LRDGTGLKLAEAIRQTGARLPVIVLAAHHLEKSDLCGPSERLVTKSIDLPELRRTVEAALRDSSVNEERLDQEPGESDTLRRPSMSH
jgi:DNA-binding response OmpR family regulator